MEYKDLRIEIGPATPEAGRYHKRIRSPAGEGSGHWVNPYAVAPTAWRGQDPKEVGETLFGSLFAEPELLGLYAHSLGQIHASDELHGLRLRLSLNLSGEDFLAVDALPWELLRRPEEAHFPVRSRRVPLVRSPLLLGPVRAPRLPSKLRILGMPSSPEGLGHLDLDGELEVIRTACRDRSRVDEPTFLDASRARVSLATLHQVLLEAQRRSKPFHVLHFMGHGRLDRGSRQGSLGFEADAGGVDWIEGERLADEVRDFTLRLIVLNACYGAAGTEAFASVARHLLLGGVPAVVAIRERISDEAAVAFAGALYQALAAGDPVDTAMAEGRLAIGRIRAAAFPPKAAARPENPPQWARPLLFLRGEDGRLFSVPRTPVEVSMQEPEWTTSAIGTLQEGLGDFLDMPPASVRVRQRKGRSSTVVLDLPKNLTDELIEARERNDEQLKQRLALLPSTEIRRPGVMPWMEAIVYLLASAAPVLLDRSLHWLAQAGSAITIELPRGLAPGFFHYLLVSAPVTAALWTQSRLPQLGRPLRRPFRAALLALALGAAFVVRPVPGVGDLEPMSGSVDVQRGHHAYLFVRPVEGDSCWLQAPVPLIQGPRGGWRTVATFSGPSRQRFEVLAVASQRALHSTPFSHPDRYPCSAIPPGAARTVLLVEHR